MDDYSSTYARYYDLLTSHKDYAFEASVLKSLLRSKGIGPVSRILSVGCGTGNHERILAEYFKTIVGIDTSQPMIDQARAKNNFNNLLFEKKDIRYFEIENFDVAISLFNVINCLQDASLLLGFFQEISRTIRDGGIFIFEMWNPIQTVSVPPTVVRREYSGVDIYLERVARPTLHPSKNYLKIQYNISGVDGAEEVSFRSVHDIFLHSFDVVRNCLLQSGFEDPVWCSALAQGSAPYKATDRMILASATKKITSH